MNGGHRDGSVTDTTRGNSMVGKRRWAFIALIFFVACVNGKNQEDSSAVMEQREAPSDSVNAGRSPLERSSYEVIQVSDSGGVQGVIRLSGPAPALVHIPVEKDRSTCGSPTSEPSLRLGPGGEVADAVVSIVGISKGAQLLPLGRPANLELKHCAAVPHLQLVPLGTTLEIVNGDPILHEVHGVLDGSETLFDVVLPIQHFRAQRRMDRPGLVTLTCSAGHPWMRGYLVVQEHPYYTLTDASGRYLLKQVPSGSYRLKVWHELLGEKEVGVTIENGATVRTDFELEARTAGSS